MTDIVWTVLVQHADRSAWIDGAYARPEDAEARVLQIEKFNNWLDAYVIHTPVHPAERENSEPRNLT